MKEDLFVRLARLSHEVDGVEERGGGSVAGEDLGSDWALERGEAEEISTITAEDELDEAIAEPAKAVVEEDGVGRHSIPSYPTLDRTFFWLSSGQRQEITTKGTMGTQRREGMTRLARMQLKRRLRSPSHPADHAL